MVRKFWRRVSGHLRKQKIEQEMDAEMRFHLEMETAENIRRGMSEEEARLAAQRSFGGVEQTKELYRDVARFRWLEDLWQDLRFGVRTLVKNPSFTLVSVLTLALGIGANAAIFSFVNALLLRPLAGVAEPERLVQIGRTREGRGFDSFSYADYADYRDQNTSLAGLALYRAKPIHFGTGGEAERVHGMLVSGNYFAVLGVAARCGRTLTPQDDATPDASFVAVISGGLWRRRFGADPHIVGQTISLNARSYTVVGVAADGFVGTNIGEPVEIWVPVTMYKQFDPWMASVGVDWLTRSSTWLKALGRLKPGVTLQQAQTDLSAIAGRLAQAYPKTNQKIGVQLRLGVGLYPEARESLRRFTGLLMFVAGIVLLIACANVANLLLARATARQREIGIRLALGAGRLRVVRQLLTESVLLALAGGLFAILLAVWLNGLLLGLLPENYQGIPLELDLKPDVRVMAFTFAAALLTGVLFGLMPALQAVKLDLTPMLKEGGATGRGSSSAKLRGALVVTQVALSLVLLVAAGLCVRTLRNVRAIKPGFETERVLTAKVDLARQNYTPEQGQLFYRRLVERVATLPGVQTASLALGVPFTGSYWTDIRPEGQPKGGKSVGVSYSAITPRYFETVGISLLLGRLFTEGDGHGAPKVAIVNEAAAQQLWPDESPLGNHFVFQGGKEEWAVEVVGVVPSVKFHSLFEEPRAIVYFPAAQFYMGQDMALHVRTSGPPTALTAAIQREVSALDKGLPVYEVKTLAAQLDNELTPQRLAALLISGFGLLALALASVGLYGVMSYAVAQRTRELGVRLALGAQGADVLKLVIGQGLTLTLAGVAIGIAVAFGLTRLLASLLYGVKATDPLTFIGVSVLLIAVATFACYWPARRAAKVDPLVALRCE